jgi:hypothetical protein
LLLRTREDSGFRNSIGGGNVYLVGRRDEGFDTGTDDLVYGGADIDWTSADLVVLKVEEEGG